MGKYIIILFMIYIKVFAQTNNNIDSLFLKIEIKIDQLKEISDFYKSLERYTNYIQDSLNSVLELNDVHRLHLFTKWRLMLYQNFVSSIAVPKMYIYVDKEGWKPLKDVPKEWLYDQDTVKIKNVMYHTLWKGDDWGVMTPPK